MAHDLGEPATGPLLTAGGHSPDPTGSSPPVSFGDYAPSPNTSSQAVHRANQLRVQNLLRRLLLELDESARIDTLRMLRRTLREIDYQLSWLTQVDFLETIERLLSSEQQQQHYQQQRQQQQRAKQDAQSSQNGRDDGRGPASLENENENENENGPDTSWRLVHDATQLLIESVGRLEHEIDQQLVEAIVPSVVENLGHPRSEVRRASLLLLNLLLNEEPRYFRLLMRLFIDYGLTNYRNKQAQRGSILSLPLLISEPIVERGEDLTPLIRCLSELLLIDSNEQLFYSLFLAMQRIHLMIGDRRFQAILRHCEPEAAHLYRQAASRNNSLVSAGGQSDAPDAPAAPDEETRRKSGPMLSAGKSGSSSGSGGGCHGPTEGEALPDEREVQQQARQHVTFEPPVSYDVSRDGTSEAREVSSTREHHQAPFEAQVERQQQQADDGRTRSDSQLSATTSESLSIGASSTGNDPAAAAAAEEAAAKIPASRQFSSDVSSTCSSDAHLVNPAHYMTKAALQGNPLDHYEEIHHVDHSNITGLAINDFGPICNTPTIEFSPQLSAGIQTSLGQHLRASHQCESPAAAMVLLSSELKFGIFPRHLIQVTLHSARPADRYEAIQELMCIVRESPINHLAILMTYFDSFLEQFLAKVLLGARQRQQQTDCKLELVAIDMIETIIIKTKVSTMQFIRPIVSLLMRALAMDDQQNSSQLDQQQQLQQQHPTIFRENTCRVLHKMMAYLPPQHVIDAIFEHKHQKSSVVREEAINRVTAAILEYDRNEFNLTKLCYHVLPMLADQNAAVRLASLECIATLAHVLGPERIGSLLTAAEAVQTGCDYDGLLDAINARLMRHTLPRYQSNGIVRYALKPFLVHHQLQSSGESAPLAADVRWVLESPSLHHHQHEQAGSQHEAQHHQQQHHHHHHRLGVYSPPTVEERRRRRSSVGGLAPLDDEEPAEHHHQHHHHHHHQQQNHHHKSAARRSTSTGSGQQQQRATPAEPLGRPPSTGHKQCSSSSDQRARDAGKRQSVELDNSENRRNQSSGRLSEEAAPVEPTRASDRRRKSQTGESDGSAVVSKRRESVAAAASRTDGRRESTASNGTHPHRQRPSCQHKLHDRQHSVRRSNSQDSLSSTDTRKFKQSLADSSGNQYQAVLPSDSIIYTDINQAYEFSRHQSRFQQTSFEHEPEQSSRAAGGRHGDGPSPASVAPQGNNLNKTTNRQDAKATPASRKRSSIAKMSSSGGDSGGSHDADRSQADSRRSQSRERRQRHSRHESLSSQARPRHQQQQQQRAASEAAPAADEPNETSGSESPQTVREAGVGSHQTSYKSRPSIQRQATVVRGEQVDQSQRCNSPERTAVANQNRGSTGSGTASRRQSAVALDEVVSSGSVEALGQPGRGEERPSGAPAAEQTDGTAPKSQRQRSQSISKQSSGDSLAKSSAGNEISSRDHDVQRQTSGGGGSSRGSSKRLQRQESESTTVSSLATTSLSSGGLDQAGDAQRDERRQTRHRDDGDRSARRRASSQRRRAHSRPRTSDERGDDEPGSQTIEHDGARRRESHSQPPVDQSRNSMAHNPDEPLQSQQLEGHHRNHHHHHHPKAARLIRVRHQSNYADQQQQQQPRRGLVSESSGRASSVSPGLSNSVNIKQILENVAQVEGPFAEPQLALKVAMSALESACWSTKVEGLLALIRLAAHHPELMLAESHLHEIVTRTADETRNLRSTVARAAIYALGDYCSRLKHSIEPEMDIIVKALLTKSIENTAFIRDDIRHALTSMAEHLTSWRLATLLINQGAQHKSVHVRRMTSQFVALVVDRIGAAKALVGAREISHLLLPAAARFAQDQSPHTRYYGRLILSKLMHHSSFERLLRRNLTSTLYRSTIGTIESIKRRGCGAPPEDS